MDDFDDLLPSRSTSAFNASPTAANTHAQMAASMYAQEEDDFSSNPFADLESSRVLSLPPADADDDTRRSGFGMASPSSSPTNTIISSSRHNATSSSGPPSPTAAFVSTAANWGGQTETEPSPTTPTHTEQPDFRTATSQASSPSLSARSNSIQNVPLQTPAYDTLVSPLEFEADKTISDASAFQPTSLPNSAVEKATAQASENDTLQAPRRDHDNASVHTTSESVRTVPLSSKASSSTVSLDTTLTPPASARPVEPLGPRQVLSPEPDAGRPHMLITVSDPQKIGSEITASAHTVYTVSNNAGCVVPPPPEKHALGRFGNSFVEVRRKGLQVFLGKVAAHPMLWSDPDLKMFLESDTFAIDIRNKTAPPTPATPSFFVPAILSGQPRFIEHDEFFDHRQAQMSALEPSLRSLSQSLLAVTKSRTTLAASITALAVAVAALEACDLSMPAKKTLAGLEELTSRVQALEETIVLGGESTLASIVDSWLRLSTTSVKHAFSARTRAWTAWQKQMATVKNMKHTLEKKRSQSLVVSTLTSEITDAERKVELLKREYDDITKLVKSEMLRFDAEKVDDFRSGLAEYVDGLVNKQSEVVAAYERYWAIVENMHKANAALNQQSSPKPVQA